VNHKKKVAGVRNQVMQRRGAAAKQLVSAAAQVARTSREEL